MRDTCCRQKCRFRRTEPCSLPQGDLPGHHILARFAGVRARLDGAFERDARAIRRAILVQHNRIDAVGQQRSGQDTDRVARWNFTVKRRASRGAAIDQRQQLIAFTGRLVSKSIAIDGRVGCRGIAAPGNCILCQNTTPGLLEFHILGPDNRVQPLPQPIQRLVHRRPVLARRKGKAIVLQARRFQGNRRTDGRRQCFFVSEAKDPALLTCINLQHGVEPIRVKTSNCPGQTPDLRAIPDVIRFKRDPLCYERRPYLNECHRAVQRFEWPHRDHPRKPRPQTRQRRHSGHRLAAHGSGSAHLPKGECTLGQFFNLASLGHAVSGAVGTLAGKVRDIPLQPVEPEWPFARKHRVHPTREIETIVELWRVIQIHGEPVPEAQRIALAGHFLR